MVKISILLVLTANAWAQQQPSAGTGSSEEALRERVKQFYQFHVEGKFRAADALVAEDSKDAFFAAPKTQYKKCEVGKVTFGEDKTTAKVNTSCDSTWSFNGRRMPTVIPVSSSWKLQGDTWFWYDPPYTGKVQTPFGQMTVDPDGKHQGQGGIPSNPGAMVPGMLTQVTVDRTSVVLSKETGGHEEVKIHNAMQGLVRVSISEVNQPGLTVELSPRQINANEDAKLVIDYKPGSEPGQRINFNALTVKIHVDPTRQIIPVQVNFGTR